MMYFKKQNLSFILGFLLIILMYNTPQALKNFSKQTLGRVVLVCILLYFALDCDLACAIIFAIIIVVLLHDNREGFTEGNLLGGPLATLVKKSTENADRVQGFKGKEGMKEGEKHGEDDHTHNEEEEEVEVEDKEEKKKKGKKGEQKDDDKKEGFVGLDDMKNVTNKLQNYLGFSITDLDRFMKTSGEKNTIASTKDL
jgi:hypothetical protein